MTPLQFHALWQRWCEEQERLDRRAALAPWVLASIYRKKGKRAPRLEDYLLHRYGSKRSASAQAPRRRQTWQQQLAIAQAMTVALGGTVNLPAEVSHGDERR